MIYTDHTVERQVIQDILGRVRSQRRETENRVSRFTFRRYILWRWLLPYEAGKHDGVVSALVDMELELRTIEAELLARISKAKELSA